MRSPQRFARRFALGAVVTTVPTALALVLAACSSASEEPRRGFDVPDTSTPDAVLPPPGSDAGYDANVPRDPYDPADVPVTCGDAGVCATQIVAGRNHFCVRLADGTARCWGDDEYGALGGGDRQGPPKDPKDDADGGDAGDAGAKSRTTAVAGLTGITQLSAGDATSCARLASGEVHCWGRNSTGQLGLSAGKPSFDEMRHADAMPVDLTDAASAVHVGPRNACAILAGGNVVCWGTNELAQLARDGATLDWVLGPGPATVGAPLARMTIGSGTLVGVTAQGTLLSWGATYGNNGLISGRMSSVSPDPVPNAFGSLDGAALAGITSVASSPTYFKDEGGTIGAPTIGPIPPGPPQMHAHACAIAKGEVYCWGRSDTGALGTGLPDQEIAPTHAPIKSKAWPQRIALADEISCVRMTDGSIQCCGGDASGRFGTGRTDVFAPLFSPITSFTGKAVDVAVSNRAVCALLVDGTVQCWGSNAFGELALPENDDAPHPTPVTVTF